MKFSFFMRILGRLMRLGVENLAGRFLCVDVKEDATVRAVKEAIAKKDGELAEERLVLVRGGRIMRDDERPAREYGAEDGSVLHLFFTSVDPTPWPKIYEEDCFSFVLVEG